MVHQPVPRTRLDREPDLEPPINRDRESKALSTFLEALYNSKRPVLITDALVSRVNASTQVRTLADRLQVPAFTTTLGKSILYESNSYFQGVYAGSVSAPGVVDAVEKQSDLVIDIGYLGGDMNTSYFTRNIPEEKHVLIQPNSVKIKGEVFSDVYMKSCKHLSLKFSTRLISHYSLLDGAQVPEQR